MGALIGKSSTMIATNQEESSTEDDQVNELVKAITEKESQPQQLHRMSSHPRARQGSTSQMGEHTLGLSLSSACTSITKQLNKLNKLQNKRVSIAVGSMLQAELKGKGLPKIRKTSAMSSFSIVANNEARKEAAVAQPPATVPFQRKVMPGENAEKNSSEGSLSSEENAEKQKQPLVQRGRFFRRGRSTSKEKVGKVHKTSTASLERHATREQHLGKPEESIGRHKSERTPKAERKRRTFKERCGFIVGSEDSTEPVKITCTQGSVDSQVSEQSGRACEAHVSDSIQMQNKDDEEEKGPTGGEKFLSVDRCLLMGANSNLVKETANVISSILDSTSKPPKSQLH